MLLAGDIETLDLAALEQFELISAASTEDTVLSNGIKLPKGTAIFILMRPTHLQLTLTPR